MSLRGSRITKGFKSPSHEMLSSLVFVAVANLVMVLFYFILFTFYCTLSHPCDFQVKGVTIYGFIDHHIYVTAL